MNTDRLKELKKKAYETGLMEGGTHIYWPLIRMVHQGTLDQELPTDLLAHVGDKMTPSELREYALLQAEAEGTSKGAWRTKINK